MNQDRKIDGRGVGSSMAFANQWVGGADAGWTVRRRIMAILRASCRVLGIKRRNRGLGLLGTPGTTPTAEPVTVAEQVNKGASAVTIFVLLGQTMLSTPGYAQNIYGNVSGPLMSTNATSPGAT